MVVSSEDLMTAIAELIQIIEKAILDLEEIFKGMEIHDAEIKEHKRSQITEKLKNAAFTAFYEMMPGPSFLKPESSFMDNISNIASNFKDNVVSSECVEKVKKIIGEVDTKMSNLQELVMKFNEQVENSLLIENIDRNSAFYISFGSSLMNTIALSCISLSSKLQASLATGLINSADSLQSLAKRFGFFLDSKAPFYFTPGMIKGIGKVASITGVVFSLWEAYNLLSSLDEPHPTLSYIRDVCKKLRAQACELNEGLSDLRKTSSAARETTTAAIILFLEILLGGGYQTSKNSTVTPLTYFEFVEQIGRGTKGGLFHLMFMAEMLGQKIEIFDRTSDNILQRHHGTSHLKIEPFVQGYERQYIFRMVEKKPIMIELVGEHGTYHYNPLSDDGAPIEVKNNSPYANRCLFDAMAFQLRMSTENLIRKFQTYLRNNNSVAQELYEMNIQEVFPEFTAGAIIRKNRKKGKPVRVVREPREGNGQRVKATVRYENLYGGSAPTHRIRRNMMNRGIKGWDDAGHVIASALGGSGDDLDNFEPMQFFLNRGPFNRFEHNIRNILERNQTWRADISVLMIYNPNSAYPDRPIYFNYEVKFFDANGVLKEVHQCLFENTVKNTQKEKDSKHT